MLQWNKGLGCRALVPHFFLHFAPSFTPEGSGPRAQRRDSVVKKPPACSTGTTNRRCVVPWIHGKFNPFGLRWQVDNPLALP
jgi:hypothetical protein